MIETGDIVTIDGEAGEWEVEMAGTGSPMVRVMQNKNAATWKMVDRGNLALVSKAVVVNPRPSLIPKTNILD